MYSAKPAGSGLKKFIPLASFLAMVLVSSLLTGSARIPESILNSGPSAMPGIRISGAFHNVEIADALKRISLEYNVRIYSTEEISGRVTANFFNTPLEEVLSKILGSLGYSYKYSKDGIHIERGSGGPARQAGGPALKRLFIAPSFISAARARSIIELNRSEEAVVSPADTGAVVILDERPEIADTIMKKIADADAEAAEHPEPAGKTEQVTKLFTLRGTDVSEAAAEIRKRLSPSGSAFPNEGLNSIIVTDDAASIAGVEKLVRAMELKSAAVETTCRVFELPPEIAAEVARAGYRIGRAAGGNASITMISGKSGLVNLIGSCARSEEKLSADSGDFVEVDAKYFEKLNTRIRIYPKLLGDGRTGVTMRLESDARTGIDNGGEAAVNFEDISYSANLAENDCLVVSGFERTPAEAAMMAAMPRWLPCLPIPCGTARTDRGPETAPVRSVIMLIDFAAIGNGKGLPKYSFINASGLSEAAAMPKVPESSPNRTGYLEMFGNASVEPEASGDGAQAVETAERADTGSLRRSGKIEEDVAAAPNRRTAKAAPAGEAGQGGEKEREIGDALLSIEAAMKENDYKKAIAESEKLLNKHPDAHEVRIALGNAFKEARMFVSARNEWRRALEAGPGNEKLAEGLAKLEKLISMIKKERKKLARGAGAAELDGFLR